MHVEYEKIAIFNQYLTFDCVKPQLLSTQCDC